MRSRVIERPERLISIHAVVLREEGNHYTSATKNRDCQDSLDLYNLVDQQLHAQDATSWALELDLRPSVEKF